MDAPFRGTEALAAGLVARHQLFGPRFRRIFSDVYAPAELELTLAVRSRAAFLLVRDRQGVLGGYSACALLGVDCAPRDAPAEVIVPLRLAAPRGLRVRRDQLAAVDVVEADGCRVTSPQRRGWDLARRLPLVEGVVAVDALARNARLDPAELLARRARQPGARGCRRSVRVVALADARAESPPEPRLRVRLVLAGLPRPEVQYVIVDERGWVLARAGLACPGAKLAIEYDGAVHFDRRRGERDRQRDAELAARGWLTLRLGPDDLYAMPQTVRRVWTLIEQRTASGSSVRF